MGHPNASVPSSALDNRAPRPEGTSRLLSKGDDGEGSAVLDGTARVHELGLGEDVAAGAVRQVMQPHQWRPAHQPREA